jgi:hypothetical protein
MERKEKKKRKAPNQVCASPALALIIDTVRSLRRNVCFCFYERIQPFLNIAKHPHAPIAYLGRLVTDISEPAVGCG